MNRPPLTPEPVIKSFRYRLYPTKRQMAALESELALCAELYNAALQERRDAWRLNRVSVSRFSQIGQLKEIKAIRPDIKELHWSALEDVLKRVDRAFGGFFRRVKRGEKAGYPRFRSARRYDSMTFRRDLQTAVSGNKLRVPGIGQVRIKLSRPLEGSIKGLNVKREAGRWYATFSVEVDCVPLPACSAKVGLDLGLSAFATLDDGTEIENPRWFKSAQPKVRRAQRRVARRTKGSNRRRKAAMLLQRVHAHVRSQRADFHHKLSRWLVNSHGLIAVEDLNVKGLARTRLAKPVNDAGWSGFIKKLSEKAEEAARLLVKVDCRGTSQTCVCGAEVRKTLSERWHSCQSCGLSLPRDHVSAQVILKRAEAVSVQAPT